MAGTDQPVERCKSWWGSTWASHCPLLTKEQCEKKLVINDNKTSSNVSLPLFTFVTVILCMLHHTLIVLSCHSCESNPFIMHLAVSLYYIYSIFGSDTFCLPYCLNDINSEIWIRMVLKDQLSVGQHACWIRFSVQYVFRSSTLHCSWGR